MKILTVVSTIDLTFRLGCTPAWWQLFKALWENGNEVIVIPYLGKPVESLWWRTYDNPCHQESVTFNSFLEWRKQRGISPSKKGVLTPVFNLLIENYIRPKWEKHLLKVLRKEKGIDCVLFINVPINHITGIPSLLKQKAGIPIAYYDGDMPTILPQYTVDRGFKFDYYEGADLKEYDAFFTNSKGCIPDLEGMGAKNVHPLYYGIDPELCAPFDIPQDIDVSFYGHGSSFREEWLEKLITIPSRKMPQTNFVAAGGGFAMDLGNAKVMGSFPYSALREFCCRSKINLNIARRSHANIYASSTCRVFELAALGICIVSQPYNGIEEWFEPVRELIVVGSEDEAVEVYRHLLGNERARQEIGRRARARVLSEHTFRHRAQELTNIISNLKR